jgi:excisionase family DNA binding protein
MTAREVADLMSMPVSTVYRLARQGELPRTATGSHLAVPAPPDRGPPRMKPSWTFTMPAAANADR